MREMSEHQAEELISELNRIDKQFDLIMGKLTDAGWILGCTDNEWFAEKRVTVRVSTSKGLVELTEVFE